MKKLKVLKKWLKENENKPVTISVIAFEFGNDVSLEDGYTITNDYDSDFFLTANNSDNNYHLMLDSNCEFTFDKNEMEVESDCEIGSKHFTLCISLI